MYAIVIVSFFFLDINIVKNNQIIGDMKQSVMVICCCLLPHIYYITLLSIILSTIPEIPTIYNIHVTINIRHIK